MIRARRRSRRQVVRAAASSVVAVATLAAVEPAVRAADPLNSSNGGAPVDRAPAHDKVDVVPLVGGTSDIGLAFGAFGAVTRLDPDRVPYAWRLEASALVSFKSTDGALETPQQDVYVKLSLPRVLGLPATLDLRPSYTWEKTLGYYGLGNAASATAPAGAGTRYFQYARLHPTLDGLFKWKLVDHLAGRVGIRFTHNQVDVAPGTKLADDIQRREPAVDSLVRTHEVALFSVGAQWDDRDGDVSPHRGSFHQLDVKASPGGTPAFPYQYVELGGVARAFVPLAGKTATLALRAVGDLLLGSPPFYELAKFDDFYAIGGNNGVRGVPAQRYHGKVKVLGNVELRTELVPFHALGKDLIFGVVAFVDGGRVWADLHSHPELDGAGLGVKVGAGGGLRLLSGDTFAVRADVAWSPDARPVGGYFGAGQMF